MFIVSGDGPRCGSSMVMYALQQGGMELAYHEWEDMIASMDAEPGYHPSPRGRFELRPEFCNPVCFPQGAAYYGRVVKAFPYPWTPFMSFVFMKYSYGVPLPGSLQMDETTRILWLHRPAEERWASFERAHRNSGINLATTNGAARKWREACAEYALETLRENFPRPVFLEVDYSEIVESPREIFRYLKFNGWPVDMDKAAEAVRSGATKS